MFGRGRHRRTSNRRLRRTISRASIALTAGGAGIALPLLGAGHATAAEAHTKQPVAHTQQARPATADLRSAAKGSYTVVHGDTLSGIARTKHLAGGWHKLYEANRQVVGGDPDLILPGQQLTLSTARAQQESAPAKPAQPAKPTTAANTAQTTPRTYADNLDGWIRQALDVMHAHNIPGSYEGIHRNIMRESAGNPNAVNNWDINAQNGTPSKGLLQVIAPTFAQYHVAGTANNMTDPVANIVAACNYAAAQYGSIDNVNGPY